MRIINDKCVKKTFVIFCLLLSLVSCKNNVVHDVEIIADAEHNENDVKVESIDVKFKLASPVKYDNKIIEDKKQLLKDKKEHSVKYYSYVSNEKLEEHNFSYYDVTGNIHYMKINEKVERNDFKWIDSEGVFSKTHPINHKMSYGIDISKHNNTVDFNRVKAAGFEFVFIRIAYRGYGSAGNLRQDEMCESNLEKARTAGLKVGAYVFSQATNVDESIEEAKFAIKILDGYKLDLPLVFDPETIKNDIARTDNVAGHQFTDNAVAFCEEVKKAGYKPAIYSNMVWEDYYYDLSRLSDYEIWYADYNKLPQTPYDFKYWQFSEIGIVDGLDGAVDLNVMIE